MFLKKKLFFIFASLILLITLILPNCLTASTSYWNDLNNSPNKEPQIEVIESSLNTIVLRVTIPALKIEEKEQNGINFRKIYLEDANLPSEEIGKPDLPMILETLAIPVSNTENAVVYFEPLSEKKLENILIYPIQDPPETATEFSFDKKFYEGSNIYPKNNAQFFAYGCWHNLNVGQLGICPFKYDTQLKKLTVFDSFILRIEFSNATGYLRDDKINITTRYRQILTKSVKNYKSIDNLTKVKEYPIARYLIITHSNFKDAIQRLADWHHKRGYFTEVITIDTNNPEDIKKIIENKYIRTKGQLEYVLLVGDTPYTPIYIWGDVFSDLWYACITKDPYTKELDLFADVGFGRLSVNNVSELNLMLDKIETYTKSPPSGDWFKKALFVAAQDDKGFVFSEYKEDVRTQPYLQSIVIDTAYGNEELVNNDTVTNAINEGRIIVNYHGHGTVDKWAYWCKYPPNWPNSWSIEQIENLNNGKMMPWVFNIACNTGSIDMDECLAEAWTRKEQAAIATIGSTAESNSYPNCQMDKAIFEAIYAQDIYDLASIMDYARARTIGYPLGDKNAKMFVNLGDPALEIWTDNPKDLLVFYPEIKIGNNKITVRVLDSETSVEIENALVCLYKEKDVYQYGYTDSNGKLTFNFKVNYLGIMNITATAHNYLPFEGQETIEVN